MASDIATAIKRLRPVIQAAADAQLNESDTRVRVQKFIEEVLGFDMLEDVTGEHAVKKSFVDFAVKIDGKLAFFIEVKDAATKLKENHLLQASNYAVNAGIEWAILTNAVEWRLYHIEFTKPVGQSLVLRFNVIEDPPDEVFEKAELLARKSWRNGDVQRHYEKVSALAGPVVLKVLFDEQVLARARRAIRRNTGILVGYEDIVKAIRRLLNEQALSSLGDVRISFARKRTPRPRKTSAAAEPAGAPDPPAPPDAPSGPAAGGAAPQPD